MSTRWICVVYATRDGECYSVDDSFRWDDCDREAACRRARNICRRMRMAHPTSIGYGYTLYRCAVEETGGSI